MIYELKKLAQREKEKLKNIASKNICLAMVLCSDDIASAKYVEYKEKLLDELGISYKKFVLNNANQEQLNSLLQDLSKDDLITGIMLELPLNKNINQNQAIENICPEKDVDGLTNQNLGKLIKNENCILPCTVKAVAKILEDTKINLEGKHVVILGRSILLGKPLQMYLTNKNATCTLCHSKTQNLKEITQKADILVVAIGKKHFITRDYIQKGCFVVDVGTNYLDGKVYGDVDFENVSDEYNFVTPVPNGVGLLTKICMVENLIELFQRKQ